MKTALFGLAAAGLLIVPASPIEAGLLAKRHQIELRLGMWNQVADVRTEVTGTGTRTSVGSNGMAGGIAYGNWLQEGLALQISVGLMAADVTTETGITGTSTETAVVGSFLIGTKFYFPRSTYGGSVRPFIKAMVGPYIGSQTESITGVVIVTESRNETAFGGLVGGGVDFVVGRHFIVGVSAGYNLMTDFGQPIGGSNNYSGPEATFAFSFVFGGGGS